MKLALIRCQQTEDMCPSISCLKVIKNKEGAFKDIDDDIELIAINSCGGCPGKKIITRVNKMVRLGADAVALASCLKIGTPIGFPCPYLQQISNCIVSKHKDIKFFDWTHS